MQAEANDAAKQLKASIDSLRSQAAEGTSADQHQIPVNFTESGLSLKDDVPQEEGGSAGGGL